MGTPMNSVHRDRRLIGGRMGHLYPFNPEMEARWFALVQAMNIHAAVLHRLDAFQGLPGALPHAANNNNPPFRLG
ncbi:hypothetical protein V5799_021121 [Amblyomma americanum]|uniref:Uncharacterized protein n=1 Tax=Amblyomma americanum TaxID=6943 RepID=A0AAQ4FRA7_AMBAM